MSESEWRFANDDLTAAFMAGKTLPEDELNDAVEQFDMELEYEQASGLRGSPVDPPFATLIKRAEALNPDEGNKVANRLHHALNIVEEELDALVSGFQEWTEHIAVYGFSAPERTVALCIVAAIEPELRQARLPWRLEDALPVARWLLAHPVSFRILRTSLSFATCTYEGPKLALVQRRFLRGVCSEVRAEIRDMERSNERR